MRIEQLTVGWDDPTQVNWDEGESAAETVEAPAAPLYKCTALYSYSVSLPTNGNKAHYVICVSSADS